MKKLILFLILIDVVAAQSIGISPGSIEINGKEGDIIKKSFIVINPEKEDIEFKIIFGDNINVHPKEGYIKAENDKEIKLDIKLIEIGNYEDKIIIKSKNHKNKESVSIDSGIALKLKMNVKEKIKEKEVDKVGGIIIVFTIIFLGLLIYFKLKPKPYRNTSSFPIQ